MLIYEISCYITIMCCILRFCIINNIKRRVIHFSIPIPVIKNNNFSDIRRCKICAIILRYYLHMHTFL